MGEVIYNADLSLSELLVALNMPVEVGLLLETLVTLSTDKPPFACVICNAGLSLLELLVALNMVVEVVTTHETLVTLSTDKPPFACVNAEVSLKQKIPIESLATAEPVTDEGSFPGVLANVIMKVTGPGIHL